MRGEWPEKWHQRSFRTRPLGDWRNQFWRIWFPSARGPALRRLCWLFRCAEPTRLPSLHADATQHRSITASSNRREPLLVKATAPDVADIDGFERRGIVRSWTGAAKLLSLFAEAQNR
jgi:hypothetical protein